MTVPTTASVVEYVSDGTLKTFPTTFGFVFSSDIRVSTLNTDVPPVETPLVEGVDYAVTGGGRADISGTVTLVTAATAGHKVRIRRVVPTTQLTDFVTQGAFFPESHTAALDRLTHMVQQLNDGAVVAADLFDFTGGDGTAATVFAAGTTTARALGGRFGEVLNVRDFGAAGDDVADDTAAIQDALDEAGTQNKAVFFPPGTYSVTDQLVLPLRENLLLFGAAGAIVHGEGFDGAVFCVSGADTRGLTIRDLEILGDGKAGAVDGISCSASSGLRFENLHISQCRYGLRFSNVVDCRGFVGLMLELNDTDVRFNTVQSRSLHFMGCDFRDSNKAAEQLVGLEGVSFVSCTFAASRLAGSSTTPVSFFGYENKGLAFLRCRFEQGKAAPSAVTVVNLKIGGLDGFYLAGPVRVDGCVFAGASVSQHINVGPHSSEVRIVGNVFEVGPSSDDIYFNSVYAPVIEHNFTPAIAQRDCIYTVAAPIPRLRGRIWCMRAHTQLVLETLTGGAGVRTVTWNLGAEAFPNAMTRVELLNVDASTAILGGLVVAKMAAGTLELHYEVASAGAANGSVDVVAYGY